MKVMKEYGTYADYAGGDYHDKMFLFQLTGKRPTPTFTKYDGTPIYYPRRKFVNLIDTIYDRVSGIRRHIRYSEGALTIFSDEQSKDVDLKRKLYRCEFKDGLYSVQGTNPKLLEFLFKTDLNESNPHRDSSKVALFKFVDKSAGFKAIMEKEEKEQDAVHWCNKAPFTEVLRYSRVLLGEKVNSMDSMEVRYNLKRFAKSRPDRFMGDMKTPKIIRKSHILEAIDKELLALNNVTRSLAWRDNMNAPIITAPVGKDVIDHFVDSSFTMEGEKVYNALKDYLFPKEEAEPEIINTQLPTENPAPVYQEPQLSITEDTTNELSELFDMAHEAGLIKRTGNWHMYKKWKAMGKPKFIQELKANKKLLETLRENLRKVES